TKNFRRRRSFARGRESPGQARPRPFLGTFGKLNGDDARIAPDDAARADGRLEEREPSGSHVSDSMYDVRRGRLLRHTAGEEARDQAGRDGIPVERAGELREPRRA